MSAAGNAVRASDGAVAMRVSGRALPAGKDVCTEFGRAVSGVTNERTSARTRNNFFTLTPSLFSANQEQIFELMAANVHDQSTIKTSSPQ